MDGIAVPGHEGDKRGQGQRPSAGVPQADPGRRLARGARPVVFVVVCGGGGAGVHVLRRTYAG